jgi:prophage regulatory protein
MDSVTFLRPEQIKARRKISNSTFYRLRSQGLIVPPVHLGPNARGYPEHEIAALDRAIIAGKSEDDIRKLVQELVAARSDA